ncbi:MAG: uroporphyrinogen-III synthase, partial [candidate division Zixibacteria bacterium]|nr:uroporphyrinogen-III synthase [candidate division Zixibacteria bacterium]
MKIGITRDINQLAELEPLAIQRKIELLSVPVIKIEPIDFEFSFEDNPDWILFTSANAVSIFFQYLKKNNQTLPPQTKIASIGKKTSNRIKTFGYSVSFEARKSYGDIFFKEFIEKIETEPLRIIFLRGEKINFEPNYLFENHNFQSIICYRTVEVDIDKSQIDKLTKDDYLLFTAEG